MAEMVGTLSNDNLWRTSSKDIRIGLDVSGLDIVTDFEPDIDTPDISDNDKFIDGFDQFLARSYQAGNDAIINSGLSQIGGDDQVF